MSGKIKATELDTVSDRIAAYYTGLIKEEDLRAGDLERLNRMERLWSLLCNFHSAGQAVKKLMRDEENAGKPISTRTAYELLREATTLWGDITVVNRRGQLAIMKEYVMQVYQMAAKDKDLKEMNKAVFNMIRLSEQQEEITALETEPHNFVLEVHFHQGDNQKGQPRTIPLQELHKMKKQDFYEVVDAIEVEEVDTQVMAKMLDDKYEDEQGTAEI